MDTLIVPLVLGIGLVSGLGTCLYLFLNLKRESSRALRIEIRERETAIARLSARLEGLEAAYKELAEASQLLVPPKPPRSGLNFSRRSQILQMARRGEPAEQIAATLGLPRNEVDLTLKIQALLLSNA